MNCIEWMKIGLEAFIAFTATFFGVYISMGQENKRENKKRLERGKKLLQYVIAELEQIHTVLSKNRPLSEALNRNYSFRSYAIEGMTFEQLEVFSAVLGTRLLMFREEVKSIRSEIEIVRTKDQNVGDANRCKTRWNFKRLERIEVRYSVIAFTTSPSAEMLN